MSTILIVGAGPTGLTLAATLARYGITPRVIDRAVVPPADRARAIVLQARTLEIFEDLGIVDEVLATGLEVDRANLFTPRGGHGSIMFRMDWIESRYTRVLTLPQEETERILTALVARSGIAVERGVELVDISQDASGAEATLRHADGRVERARADWIVGCDGAHSAVRLAAGLGFPGVTYPDECQLGDVDLDWAAPDGQVTICPVTDGVLLAFPLAGRHRFRIIMILPSQRESDDRHLSREEFLAQLTRMAPTDDDGQRREPVLLEARWLTRYRLHRRGATAYRAGRCFVAGDAAHIHSPAGAQGMNTGIQDAWNLGWKLALASAGECPEWVLDTYHDERHRVGEFLLRNTDRMFAALAGGGTLGRILRRVMPSIGVRAVALPCVGRRIVRFVSQTGIRYRASGLSSEGPRAPRLGADAPRAGDRVPDLDLGNGERLAPHLHGPGYVLLLFAGSEKPMWRQMDDVVAECARRYGGRVRCVTLRAGATDDDAVDDASGSAHRRFGAGKGAAYLVRPDGYVAWRDAGVPGDSLWTALEARINPIARSE